MMLIIGSFIINTFWTTNDLNEDVLASKIEYTNSVCKSYNFIQTAKVVDNKNQDIIWKMGEAPRNLIKSSNGYFVDHQAFKCSKNNACSPYYSTYWSEGSQKGTNKTSAKMEDYPFGWSEYSSIKLETCVKCEDDNQIKECVTWGGEFPLVGNKVIYSNTIGKPSKDFTEALDSFNKYYKN